MPKSGFQSQRYGELIEPLAKFTFGLKASETKRQYPRRLEVFLDFLGFDGLFETKVLQFYNKAKKNKQWITTQLIRFLD
jgi:hypothetical protein